MNTIKNFTTIHLRLNSIGALEVVILLMTYLITYVFQINIRLKSKRVQHCIVGIDESKILTKNISCECKCIFDGKCNSDQWWKNDKYQCECKKRHAYEKDYIWNPATCSSKN